MKSKIKKFAVLAASLVLTLAMTVPSFAAGSSNPANPTAVGNIVIEKNLKVINPTLTSVDGPGVTFHYAVAPETPSEENGGLTITDNADPAHTGTVHVGPADGITLSAADIAYPVGTAVDAAASPGADNVKNITATADITKFTAPGIYRYKLTETQTGKADCDVQNTEDDRYIDVYVENDTTGLKFAGVVMHDGTTADGKPSQKKTFDNASFETVNVTLQKTVEGNMADRNNQFPFAGTVTDHGRYFYAKKAEAPTAIDADKIAGAASGSAVSTALAHQAMYYIRGLSHTAAVAYTETNNTQDTYQTSITGGTASAASAVAPNGTKAMASTDVDSAAAVVFNNKLDSVSPTGVIMRFGPYVGMVAIAAVLIAMRKKAKANN